jgi:hypothetical protein
MPTKNAYDSLVARRSKTLLVFKNIGAYTAPTQQRLNVGPAEFSSGQFAEKEIKSANPAFPTNDEISPGVNWRLTTEPAGIAWHSGTRSAVTGGLFTKRPKCYENRRPALGSDRENKPAPSAEM